MARVLFVAEQCNPEWPSVPLVAYNLWNALSRTVDIRLVTHVRNREAIEAIRGDRLVDYIEEPSWVKRYYSWVHTVTSKGNTNWPLYHALSYPVYEAFNRRVYAAYSSAVKQGKYDLVHAFTPVLPRYPVALASACRSLPFVLGPVNGGLPFPDGFSDVKRREGGFFNFLRSFTRFIPAYAATYNNAALVLAGSRYTRDMLANRFAGVERRMKLFHENGLAAEFFNAKSSSESSSPFTMLFVGRLVPYKGADMLLKAVARSRLTKFSLVIVGDGPEKSALEGLARELGIADKVRFTGWIPQGETADYYAQADLFTFPSVREFGGAVVLEAMAAGTPCVVVDHGGIGEYVNESCGVRVEPKAPEFIVAGFAQAIQKLANDRHRLAALAYGAVKRAEEYRWERKAEWLTGEYEKLLRKEE